MKILTRLPDPEKDYVLVEMNSERAKKRLKELVSRSSLDEAILEVLAKCEPVAFVPAGRVGEHQVDLILTPKRAFWAA